MDIAKQLCQLPTDQWRLRTTKPWDFARFYQQANQLKSRDPNLWDSLSPNTMFTMQSPTKNSSSISKLSNRDGRKQ